MAISFNVSWNATNTASTTVPMGNLMASATNQCAIYEINSGSGATADNAVAYQIMRASARGTGSTSVTPVAVDQDVTQAAVSTFDTAWNINPTITASSQILQWGQHQRGTYRWVAYDYTKSLRCQAGTGKGMALMSFAVSSAFLADFSISYDE
jgi:hypothetical protein